MARWRLTQPHYLNVEGNEWEYTETSKATGKTVRNRFPVPLLLNPDNPADQNRNGEITVYQKDSQGKATMFDHTFTGQPTPDMEPLDDEAEAISKALEPTWKHPIETLGGNGFADDILQKLNSTLEALIAKSPIEVTDKNPVSMKGVSDAQMAEIMRRLEALEAENVALRAEQPVHEPLEDDDEPAPVSAPAPAAEARRRA